MDVNNNTNPTVFYNLLKECGILLNHWSRINFGDIRRRLKNIQNQISSLQDGNMQQNEQVMVKNLESQLDHLLEVNEAYWKQRSTADWLVGGDRNTKFFHHKSSSRRHHN